MDEVDAYNYQTQQSNARTSSDEEYAGAIREEKIRTLISEIDPSQNVEPIIMRLRGYRFNRQAELWERSDKALIVSDNFVVKVEYILSNELSLNTTFGNLQPNDVNRMMEFLIETLTNDVIEHGQNYSVTYNQKEVKFSDDHATKEIILNEIFSSVYKALRRSINGKESERFFRSLRMNETISPPKNERGGFMESVKNLWS